jgi:hypothetical protein
MVTSQDFDRLSAYIDDQLAPAEKVALEARLAAEPELRETLRDLRLTVRALRALPAVKPPRSFTLNPAHVGAVAARRPLFPALRLATALSALVLTVVVAGDLGGGMLATRTAVTNGEAETAITELVQAPAAATAASETPTAAEEVVAQTLETDVAVSAAGADTAAPEETEIMGLMAPEATPTAEASAIREMSPTAGATEKQLPADTPTPASVAEVPPAETQADLFETGAQPAGDTGASQRPAGLTPLRAVEIGLATLTVLLGLGAWVARRHA